MPETCSPAESRILTAVFEVCTLTDTRPPSSARDRLCDLLGYRLYRALVNGLVLPG